MKTCPKCDQEGFTMKQPIHIGVDLASGVDRTCVAIKCAACGHFIAYAEMEDGGGARFYFEPDSHKGPEISEWTCARCEKG